MGSDGQELYGNLTCNIEIPSQPKGLIGGELAEFQLEGLRWLLSLYLSGLNGILADEMVCVLQPLESTSYGTVITFG